MTTSESLGSIAGSATSAKSGILVRIRHCARRLRIDQSGQVLPWTALLMSLVIWGLCAAVVDAGRGVLAYHMLQSANDAAVMSAAQAMTSATSNTPILNAAYKYSAVYSSNSSGYPTGLNANPSLMPNAAMASGSPKLECLNSLVTSWNLYCTGGVSSGTGGYNAVQVTETVTIPTYFAELIGFPSITVSATSTAAMRGSPRAPYNIALIVDTTGSMGTNDSNCNNETRIACSLEAVRTLLGNISPCAPGSTCGTSSSQPMDEVALYTFPGMVNAQDVTNDVTCSTKSIGNNPTAYGPSSRSSVQWSNYIFPSSSYPIYQLINFSFDYANANPTKNNSNAANSTSLQNSSLLVQAMGGVKTNSGYTGCSGIAYGGDTYFASVIYQAQADLITKQADRLPTESKNVMIILSDGDATGGEYYPTAYNKSGALYGSPFYSMQDTNSSVNLVNPAADAYPSVFNNCQQGVDAATAAKSGGTEVYTVAYGSQASGCFTDQSDFYIMSNQTCGRNGCTGGTKTSNTGASNLTPCQTMEEMATSNADFFSDYNATGNGNNNDASCWGVSRDETNLDTIFTVIAGRLTVARLIPNNTQ
jgi:Flp pilus assembly protein TadG